MGRGTAATWAEPPRSTVATALHSEEQYFGFKILRAWLTRPYLLSLQAKKKAQAAAKKASAKPTADADEETPKEEKAEPVPEAAAADAEDGAEEEGGEDGAGGDKKKSESWVVTLAALSALSRLRCTRSIRIGYQHSSALCLQKRRRRRQLRQR